MTSKRRVLLLSSSTVYGTGYLQYAEDEIKSFLKKNDVSKILFVPYALCDYDTYTQKIRNTLGKWGYTIDSIHTFKDPIDAVNKAQAIYVGGGNTFQLLKSLYDKMLMEPIRHCVFQAGIPYIGSSAGSNVATASICTTNDMPIVYPPDFSALGLVPFNINPHYLDPDSHSVHMGESREERINQFHEIPGTPPVLGLREGSILHVEGDKAVIKGLVNARLFIQNMAPEEYKVGSDVSFLLK